MSRTVSALAASLLVLPMAGCFGNPYALNVTRPDYRQPQMAGVIRYTDPKIYRRETLINERRDETEFLDKLLENSKTITFAPDVMRELEVVTAVAGALGLSFDPSSAIKYQRDNETSEIAQQIDVMKLQLQLEQLKRDYALWQSKFAAQEAPSGDLPATPQNSTADPTSNVTTVATNQLNQAITNLTAAVNTRLNADTKPVAASTARISPFDEFQQRAAYRTLIQNAKNAASLDEMHDANGASLVRLEFSATVFPPRDQKYASSFGVLRMQVKPPVWSDDPEAMDKLYVRWLDHINTNINEPIEITGEAIDRQNQNMMALARTGEFFQVLYLGIPRPPKPPVTQAEEPSADDDGKLAGKDKDKKTPAAPANPPSSTPAPPARTPAARSGPSGATPNAPPTSPPANPDTPRRAPDDPPATCVGIWDSPKFPKYCRYLAFVIPLGADFSLLRSVAMSDDSRGFQAIVDGNTRLTEATTQDNAAFKKAFDGLTNCRISNELTFPPANADITAQRTAELLQAIKAAQIATTDLVAAQFNVLAALRRAGSDFESVEQEISIRMIEIAQPARIFLDRVDARFGQSCSSAIAAKVTAPDKFRNFLEGSVAANEPYDRITLYQVGPREQTQPVSTVSRAADAVSLAAAISAAAPMSGRGASGALNLSRSAIGKVDIIERAPLVVSFAEPATSSPGNKPEPKAGAGSRNSEPAVELGPSPAFGWLLGPRVTLDAKTESLRLEQRPAPHELFADISIPGWWPYLSVMSETAWSPEWSAGKVMLDGQVSQRDVKVHLAQNSADLAGLTTAVTTFATGHGVRIPSIASSSPRTLSRCAANSTLRIWGENLWRATEVIVGGRIYSGASVRVLPDMSGVRVDIDKAEFPLLGVLPSKDPKHEVTVAVLTPYGAAETKLIVTDTDRKDCAPPKNTDADPAKKPEKPSLSLKDVYPTQISICDPGPAFTITGSGLGAVQDIKLGTIAGVLAKILKPAEPDKPVDPNKPDAKPGEKPPEKPGGKTAEKPAEDNVAALSVTFSRADMRNRLMGLLQVPLTLLTSNGELAVKDIGIVNSTCR